MAGFDGFTIAGKGFTVLGACRAIEKERAG
jgi:hypothetical protein